MLISRKLSHCAFPENTFTHSKEGHGKFQGVEDGVVLESQNFKESTV